ncbi:hypothetical protein HDV62DRAFT_53888 [Trichoderma sp. SZMC 28011]
MKLNTSLILLTALAGSSVAAPTGASSLQLRQPDSDALRILESHLSTGQLTQTDRELLNNLLVTASLRKREEAGTFSDLGGNLGSTLGTGIGSIIDTILGLFGSIQGGANGNGIGLNVGLNATVGNAGAASGGSGSQNLNLNGLLKGLGLNSNAAGNLLRSLGADSNGNISPADLLKSLGLNGQQNITLGSFLQGLDRAARNVGIDLSVVLNGLASATRNVPAGNVSLPAVGTGSTGGIPASTLQGIVDTITTGIFRNVVGGLDDATIKDLINIVKNAKGDTQQATDALNLYAAAHGLDPSKLNLLEGSGGLLGGLVNALDGLTSGRGVLSGIGLPGLLDGGLVGAITDILGGLGGLGGSPGLIGGLGGLLRNLLALLGLGGGLGGLGPLAGNLTGTLGSLAGNATGAPGTLGSALSGGVGSSAGLATTGPSNRTAFVFEHNESDEDESPRSNVRRSHAAQFRSELRKAKARAV